MPNDARQTTGHFFYILERSLTHTAYDRFLFRFANLHRQLIEANKKG